MYPDSKIEFGLSLVFLSRHFHNMHLSMDSFSIPPICSETVVNKQKLSYEEANDYLLILF